MIEKGDCGQKNSHFAYLPTGKSKIYIFKTDKVLWCIVSKTKFKSKFLISANFRAVSRIKAGSFRLPRCGAGAT